MCILFAIILYGIQPLQHTSTYENAGGEEEEEEHTTSGNEIQY